MLLETGTNDVDCINDIQRFMGYLPLVMETDARRVGFFYTRLSRQSCNNSIMNNFLFEVFGKYDLQILLTKYNITGLCSPRGFRFLACN